MRYEKRFANGYWRVFDTNLYTTVKLCYTEVEVGNEVDYFNKT